MKINFYYNAKVIKLLVVVLNLFLYSYLSIAQDDPISRELKKEKQESLGANLTEKENNELTRANKKYEISTKENEALSKQQSGQKLGLADKYRVGRANRKNYMRAKKYEKFRKEFAINRQPEKTKKRMLENRKKTEHKYRNEKNRKRKKSFFNLFK
jgi:hypothetical protein